MNREVSLLKLVNHTIDNPLVRVLADPRYIDHGGWLSAAGLEAGYSEFARHGEAWVKLDMPYGPHRPVQYRVTDHMPNFDVGTWLQDHVDFTALGAARMHFQNRIDEMHKRMGALALIGNGRLANADADDS